MTRLFGRALRELPALTVLCAGICAAKKAHANEGQPPSQAPPSQAPLSQAPLSQAPPSQAPLSQAGPAAASGGPTLDIRVPEGCGSEEEFRSALRERLPHSELSHLPNTRVLIARSGTLYELSLRSGNQRRSLHDRECHALFRAAVVVVVAASEQRLASAEKARVQAKGALTAPPPNGIGADVGAGPTFGLLPHTAWGLRLGASWRQGTWGGALSARYLPAVSADSGAKLGLEAQAWGGHLGGWIEPWSELQLYFGGVFYQLHGKGVGSELVSSGSVWAAGPLVGFTAIPVRARFMWVGVGAEAHLDLLRSSFVILPYEPIFQVHPLVGSIFLRVAPVFR